MCGKIVRIRIHNKSLDSSLSHWCHSIYTETRLLKSDYRTLLIWFIWCSWNKLLLKWWYKKYDSMHSFGNTDRVLKVLQIFCISHNTPQILLIHQIMIASEEYQCLSFSFAFSRDHKKMVHPNPQSHSNADELHYHINRNKLSDYCFHSTRDSNISMCRVIQLNQTWFFLAKDQ